jgi:NADH dehydrogenase FAD-containing subunit
VLILGGGPTGVESAGALAALYRHDFAKDYPGLPQSVVQLPRGRTMQGKAAFLAWGAVHLALLSTGEDRAKSVVDWTWAGFSHERPGRISVRPDDE